jgi:hypothetical protein
MGQRGNRGERRPIKKDRQAVQSVRQEIHDEIRGGTAVPVLQRDRNRDVARGDWDRTSRHHDEGMSREEQPADEPKPEERYKLDDD